MGKKNKKRPSGQHCALCGRRMDFLYHGCVVGATGRIACATCLQISRQVLETPVVEAEQAESSAPVADKILSPQEIMAELDKSIIGQQRAKQAVSIAIWKQLLRANGDEDIPRTNLLLYGPSGCGKTALVQEAARILDIPFISFDATTLSEIGYRGSDARDMVTKLCKRYEGHPKQAYGIIFVDEVDKLAAKGSDSRTAYNRGTQHSLLKLIEGTEVDVDKETIHTDSLLFIFGGAFTDLKKKEKRPLCDKISIFCIVVTIVSVVIWLVLFNINNMLGAPTYSTGGVGENINEPKKENLSILFAGVDKEGIRTDSIIYVKYDTVNNKLYMMSIPRDTYVDHPLTEGKINTIYRGGKYKEEFITVIEELLAVEIDYYAVINLNLVADIVEEIGGLKITLDDEVWKLNKKTNEWYLAFPKGEQVLNASQVETLVRNRDYANGDISRGNMQREVIIALIKNLMTPKTLLKLMDIKDIVLNNMDTNLTVREGMKYIGEINEIDLDNITSTSMPLYDINYVVNGTACVLVNEEKARKIIAEEWVYVKETQER